MTEAAKLSTRRECPYCAAGIRLGDCPVVATSFSGVEFRDDEEFDLAEVELYSGATPERLLQKTNWPVLREAPLRERVASVEAQRGRSTMEQAFAEFSDAAVAVPDALLAPLLEDGLAPEDVPARACPACEFPLPQSIDERRAVVVAVVGVNRVGKTHLLAASLTEAYRRRGLAAIGCTEFVPDESTGKRFMEDYYYRLFRDGEILEPTQVEGQVRFEPLVFKVTLAGGSPFSLILHDVAGEILGDYRMRARSATYLHGARGIVFVVDPRDIDDLRDGIPALMPDEEDLGWDQGTLLAACLHPDGLLDGRRRVPVAVAIAKADLLPQVSGESLPFLSRRDPGESREQFLQRIRATSREVREFLERHSAHNILGPSLSYNDELRAAGGQAAVTFHAFSALGDTPSKIEQGAKVTPINALDPLAAILSQI